MSRAVVTGLSVARYEREPVRTFTCPKCANLLFFENSACVVCGTDVGFDRGSASMLRADENRRCANAELAGCNWLAAGGPLCGCCALTRTRPADEDVDDTFRVAEAAKRRLLYQLDDLGLPTTPRTDDPEHGLAFDLLSSAEEPVTTGHAGGVITIDLAEGDDGFREGLRAKLAEPYRTMLGHVRHEVGHWYWDVLVAGDPGEFRRVFGDERADYQEALATHYASDPGTEWTDTHVSHYAGAHPWEDWAETFAHLLHIRDTVQTAAALGVLVAGTPIAPHPGSPVDAEPEDHPRDVDALMATWVPLSRALNQLNRSMGKDDLYPFALSPAVQAKLRFVDSKLGRHG
ncbi:zinc-binding metallopeptidase family protein [Amycolatopsis iheyensis]|uniref:zinc-binding metallopeptidase family protein n=1 Tax=Amycolatopsis iheyensis TaxID=2945988 RepID=UPI0021532F5B|nr:putative zinc-binding metallopeptidase [Amycolatopsis iheyensis]